MRQVESWFNYFKVIAKQVATRSKDPNTQVGAVIVNQNYDIVSTGYNGFPPGVQDTEDRWQRPLKYEFVVHAEMNAIARAARFGKHTDGGALFCTHLPCRNCAKAVIAAGVKEVYYSDYATMTKEEDIAFVTSLFKEAGVEIERI